MRELQRSKTPGHIVGIARRLRRKATSAEETLWGQLRKRRLGGAKFRRQHPIGRYIADSYCEEAHLVIELDGDVHSNVDRKEYDNVRQSIIEANGITLLRIRNQDIERDLEGVIQKVAGVLA
ncbi:MAG: hypothetical protein BZY80_06965 [SAR202 cluster bacterium Io17-Chloro-G2]|nr:MAG: hypothetical protein BZY80_06965 [SAR202 cluster bacterium Io17-Chloro-G2]